MINTQLKKLALCGKKNEYKGYDSNIIVKQIYFKATSSNVLNQYGTKMVLKLF